MPLSLDARMQMIGLSSDDHAEAARPTVKAWAVRAENLAAFINKTLSPETSPITAFVLSEIPWHKPS